MGYYALSTEGNITIRKSEQTETLNAIVEAYTAHNANESKWYDLDIPTDLEAELERAGFDFMYDSDELVIHSFDSKWHGYLENSLIPALLAHATDDSAMAFRGEDGELWRFVKGVVGTQKATILWA
jgi:hypothetical protein